MPGDRAHSSSSPDTATIDRALLAECYEELRRIARRILARDWGRMPIQPTEVAHEAMIRLLQMNRAAMTDRQHLLATAARLARQSLIDQARRIGSRKRRTPEAILTVVLDSPVPVRLEDVHRAVEELACVSSDRGHALHLGPDDRGGGGGERPVDQFG